MFLATDRTHAKPKAVIFGFAAEFCAKFEARGGLTAPVKYGKTWTRVHASLLWRDTADDLRVHEGVDVIYHATATGVLLNGDRIGSVQLWTKQGPLQVRAEVTIDASGDADLVAMAGLDDVIGDNGVVQTPQ